MNEKATGSGLGRQVAKGTAWSVFSRLAIRLIGLTSTLVLVRLLMPADFGLVALAVSFYAILDVMGAFGFDMVLIQNQNADRSYYDTAWTLTVLRGLLSAILMFAFADNVAAFYNEPRLIEVLQVLAVGMFLVGFENIGVVAFRKELEFHKEFKFLVVKKLFSFVTTMLLAFLWRDYWALIAGMLVGMLAGVVISYRMHPFRPRFSLERFGEIFHFSKWLLFNNIIHYFNRQGPDIIIGKYNGSEALGYYSVSFEISNLPTTELVFPISRAIFPGYAKLQNDLQKLSEMFLQTLGFIATLAVPMGVGVALLADLLVPLMLGDKWLAVVPLIQILAIYGVARLLISNAGSIFLALGKPHLTGYLVGVQVLVKIPLLIWAAATYGVVAAAGALLVSGLIFYPLHFVVVTRLLPLTLGDIGRVLLRPMLASLLMIFTVLGILSIWKVEGLGLIAVQVLTMVTLGALTYATTIFGLWVLGGKQPGVERIVLDEIEKRWGWRVFS